MSAWPCLHATCGVLKLNLCLSHHRTPVVITTLQWHLSDFQASGSLSQYSGSTSVITVRRSAEWGIKGSSEENERIVKLMARFYRRRFHIAGPFVLNGLGWRLFAFLWALNILKVSYFAFLSFYLRNIFLDFYLSCCHYVLSSLFCGTQRVCVCVVVCVCEICLFFFTPLKPESFNKYQEPLI